MVCDKLQPLPPPTSAYSQCNPKSQHKEQTRSRFSFKSDKRCFLSCALENAVYIEQNLKGLDSVKTSTVWTVDISESVSM